MLEVVDFSEWLKRELHKRDWKPTEKLSRQYERTAQQQEYRDRLLEFAQSRDLAEFGESILYDDPTEINRLLSALCETIVITPRYEMRVMWR